MLDERELRERRAKLLRNMVGASEVRGRVLYSVRAPDRLSECEAVCIGEGAGVGYGYEPYELMTEYEPLESIEPTFENRSKLFWKCFDMEESKMRGEMQRAGFRPNRGGSK